MLLGEKVHKHKRKVCYHIGGEREKEGERERERKKNFFVPR